MQKLNPSDIFADAEDGIRELIDPGEQAVNIDVDEIDNNAEIDARDIISNISKLYLNEEFLKKQPNLKKRIDSELESLRINLKMRHADEVAHDILLKNVACNPSNASMYKSLTELQKTILSITTKIEDTVTRLSNMLKSYQMEFNFDEEEEPEKPKDDAPAKKTYKGTKAFIEDMNEVDDDDVDIPEDDD